MFCLPMVRLPIVCLSRALFAVLFLAAGSQATAAIITQPLDLNEGDQYRLVFVTSSGTNAVPDGVAYYNDFVTAAANSAPELAALGTDWRAIVSSTTFGANENTETNSGIGVPIYRLDGLRIANNNSDLWDGTIARPINRTELDTIVSSDVRTGTPSDGTPPVVAGVDAGSINGGRPRTGVSSFADSRWVDFPNISHIETTVLPLYGMSGVLTAQAAPVPEPSSLVCLGGLLMLAGVGRSGRRFRRATFVRNT